MEAKKRVIISKKYHRYILGKGGQRWKELVNATSTKIQVPSLQDQSETIIISGTQERIRKAENELRLICEEMDSRVTMKCFIEKKYRSRVLGAKGCNVQAIREKFKVHIQFPDRSDEDAEEVEASDATPTFDEVEISGIQKNAADAIDALLNLVPITIQVEVPYNLHYLLIGRGGCEVRELKEKYNVNLLMSRPDEELDYIKIIGAPKCVEEAKKGILEKCEILKAELQEKALKSFELKVEVDSEYFPVVVGRDGVVIKKIISDHDVTISFPRIGDPDENIITITGYEKNTHSARDDIIKLINELKPKVSVVFGQFMPTSQDNPVTSSNESSSSSGHDISETINIQGETEELLLNGEFDSGDEDEDDFEESIESDESELFIVHSDDEKELENKVEEKVEVEKEDEIVSSEIDELYKNFNATRNSQFDLDKSMSLIREHAELVTEALRSREDSQKQLTEMYTNLTSKQNKEILDLRKRLNDEVSLHKTWRDERSRLWLDAQSEKVECQRYKIILLTEEAKYNEKTKTLSDTIEDLQEQLNTERDDKSKLIAENEEIHKMNNKLISEKRELETNYDIMKMDWESGTAAFKEQEISLTKEIIELKTAQSRTLKNENLKLEFYSKQLEDLKLKCDNTISRLNHLVSRNEELVKDGATKDEKINSLNTLTQQKDNEIRRMETDLGTLSIQNEELSTKIDILKNDLVTKEKEIIDIETELNSYKANVNEHVLREMGDHEAKFERIKYNVCDLKEKLNEITKDIYKSSSVDYCGMLNGFKKISDIQSGESNSLCKV